VSSGYTWSQLVEMSIDMERRGEAFYREAVAEAHEERVKALLQALARDERGHAEMFSSLLPEREETRGIVPEESQPYIESIVRTSVQAYLSRLGQVAKGSSMEVLDFALGFEKETLLFYYSLRDYVARSAVPTIERIIAEEKTHIQRIAALKSSL